jgi:nicotinamide-nucleotide amidase
MKIELVTIGDELLLGFTIDTNAAWLGRELSAIGVEIARRSTVGDDAAQIVEAVREALDRTGAVITTGGLGPTSDDITRSAIAGLFNRKMRFDENIFAGIKARWESRNLTGPLPESNRVQAEVPEGAEILNNQNGTAPGIWITELGRWVAMLPGVPREMRGIFENELLPRLQKLAPDAGVVRSLTLRTTGIAESSIADKIGAGASGLSDVKLAYLPGVYGVDLRLTLREKSFEAADQRLRAAAVKLREPIQRYVYGENSDDLAAVVLENLRSRKLKLAIAESCTGGMLGARITAIAGSSDVFVGGTIAYDNAVKQRELGVAQSDVGEFGAVSERVASAMARGVAARFGADIAAAITGIAGPDGGTEAKPVGFVWIAVHGPKSKAQSFRFGGDRREIRQRAAQAALAMLRRQFEND